MNLKLKYKSIFNFVNKSSHFHIKEMKLEGYEQFCKNVFTIESNDIDSQLSYFLLRDMIIEASNHRRYLPVIRIGDGEMRQLVGPRFPGAWWPLPTRLKRLLSIIKSFLTNRIVISQTMYSGDYIYNKSLFESKRLETLTDLDFLIPHSILAPHLSLAEIPFQEDYIIPILQLFQKFEAKVNITSFYYVYALASEADIYKDKNILVVFSKRSPNDIKLIRSKLESFPLLSVSFLFIEDLMNHSFQHELEQNTDLILLGAGLHKFKISKLLSNFNCPVLDVGYLFEVWIDPDNNKRPFCIA